MIRIVVDNLPDHAEDCLFYFESECQITTHLGCIFDNKCPHLVEFKKLVDTCGTKEERH